MSIPPARRPGAVPGGLRIAVALAATCCLLGVEPSPAQSVAFETFSHIGGTDLEAGALYRFHTVATNVDALVTIDTMSPGAFLWQVDDSTAPPASDGLYEYFQPKFNGTASLDDYVDFSIQFVTEGTTTPVSLGTKQMAIMDIDGNNVDGDTYEFVRADLFNAYRHESTTNVDPNILSLNPVLVEFQSIQNGGPPGLSQDTKYIAELDYDDLTSLSVRFGLTGNRTTAQTRLYALNFFDTPIAFNTPITTNVPEPATPLLITLAAALAIHQRRPSRMCSS